MLGTAPDVVAEVVENHCEQERLTQQISKLNGRERWVLEMRFGMPGGIRQTQRDIARKLGISRSYVSRIEKRALSKLWKTMYQDDKS